MSKPAKPIPTLSCPWLAAAVIKMPVMVPGIRKGPKKGQQTKLRAWQGLPLRLPSAGSSGSTNRFGSLNPLPQRAAVAEGGSGPKGRKGAGDSWDSCRLGVCVRVG